MNKLEYIKLLAIRNIHGLKHGQTLARALEESGGEASKEEIRKVKNLIASEKEFTITDEEIKEGDYAVFVNAIKPTPRIVEKHSKDNNTLGFHNHSASWFKWIPITSFHKKVTFKS